LTILNAVSSEVMNGYTGWGIHITKKMCLDPQRRSI